MTSLALILNKTWNQKMNIKKKTKKMSTEDKQLNLIETKVPDWTEDER